MLENASAVRFIGSSQERKILMSEHFTDERAGNGTY
uniref:Uncharacterized protein n=1 Tax=Arundo donax TaxID=35708 RepID=A0A0A8ZKL4_ARUDO